jgi:hypothetical protein
MVGIPSLFRTLRLTLLTGIICCQCAFATDTIYGSVINGTTGRPAFNDDVALLTVDHKELEVSRGKTTAQGSFRLQTDAPGPHVLRVRHDGVIYQRQITNINIAQEIKVFDAASDLPEIHGTVTVMRIEPRSDTLEVTELHSIANDSNPPRTLVNPRNLEILLPPKATLTSVVVSTPSQRAEKAKPQPVAVGSRQYAVGCPLRPGITQFAFKYHVEYIDRAVFHPRLQYPTGLWTVMFPKSMKFKATGERQFRGFADQNEMQVQALSEAKAGAVTGFVLSGKAVVPLSQIERLALNVPALSQRNRFQPFPPVKTPARPGFLAAAGKEPWIVVGWTVVGISAALLLVGLTNKAMSTRRRAPTPQTHNKAA